MHVGYALALALAHALARTPSATSWELSANEPRNIARKIMERRQINHRLWAFEVNSMCLFVNREILTIITSHAREVARQSTTADDSLAGSEAACIPNELHGHSAAECLTTSFVWFRRHEGGVLILGDLVSVQTLQRGF
jgi:hypothetical protein